MRKPVFKIMQWGKTQTGQLSHRSYLVSKSLEMRDIEFIGVILSETCWSICMDICKLIWVWVGGIWHKQVLSWCGSIKRTLSLRPVLGRIIPHIFRVLLHSSWHQWLCFTSRMSYSLYFQWYNPQLGSRMEPNAHFHSAASVKLALDTGQDSPLNHIILALD